MPLLTMKVLLSAMQLHGPNATIASDNKGVDFVLAGIRGELDEQTAPRSQPGEKLALDPSGYAKSYLRTYVRDYPRIYARTIKQDIMKQQGGTSGSPSGTTRRK